MENIQFKIGGKTSDILISRYNIHRFTTYMYIIIINPTLTDAQYWMYTPVTLRITTREQTPLIINSSLRSFDVFACQSAHRYFFLWRSAGRKKGGNGYNSPAGCA